MIRKTKEDILKLAQEFSNKKLSWHFHILTPECKLNNSDKYALILENGTENKSYVFFSESAEMDIGKQLVGLLHGKVTSKEENLITNYRPPANVLKIIEIAKDLMSKNKYWHHHMLFPDCIFNKNKGKWTIMFEDQENDKVIESVSDNEPKQDLKLIEPLFYSQK